MNENATVNAADIARLADVGRAAVSNWRRRYEDFPPPVGGTASSPQFSLPDVQDWLRRRGRTFQLSVGDRAWQRLRGLGDDLTLSARVSRSGLFLWSLHAPDGQEFDRAQDDLELLGLLEQLAGELGAPAAFEFLCERYFEAHSRRLTPTPAPIARLMTRLACPAPGTVFDPACGVGTLLLAAPAVEAFGQDGDAYTATIAALRLMLRDTDAEVHGGSDALRQDTFDGLLADAVVCDPPFNERAWGYDELVGDQRWEYGLPPRGEPELAWAQHCLAHVRPGGLVAILLPSAVAGRRTGKRIRGNLLRAGALRAVITLGATGSDLWLLRRPEPGERPPSRLLLLESGEDLSTVDEAWSAHLRDLDTAGSVRIIDLLDEDVDLGPARHRAREEHAGREFSLARKRFDTLGLAVPGLVPSVDAPGFTTVGELVRAGAVEVRHASAKPAEGRHATLTADDLAAGRGPSGRTGDEDQLLAEEGDVVASVTGMARVHRGPAAVLGPSLSRYRVDPDRIDPEFLAGCLRAAEPAGGASSTRVDVRRTRIPMHPLDAQRELGVAFRGLAEFDDAVREAAELGRELTRLGFTGLTEGQLRPGNE
ncbi:N-6 DNA methylase [Amycolatopsis sp. H20-H5]|uniref:N-6 DNA methylase n=1 Tax=Amycolatopsis sp. H20-H5 TaxID=3046309 RepID=UPI002DBE952C|nr:N-6 DNA methylase [Amycolatopsis sp. H20-H5]MEC3975167.1 N-6 DNA methylase [Amycolatopsis sp. H20-H5]